MHPFDEVDECEHGDVEYDPGNHVPPYGWELPPGYFCVECGEEISLEEMEDRNA